MYVASEPKITNIIKAYLYMYESERGSKQYPKRLEWKRRGRLKGITRPEEFYIIRSVPICCVLILHSGRRGKQMGRGKEGRRREIYNSKGEFVLKKKRKIKIT